MGHTDGLRDARTRAPRRADQYRNVEAAGVDGETTTEAWNHPDPATTEAEPDEVSYGSYKGRVGKNGE